MNMGALLPGGCGVQPYISVDITKAENGFIVETTEMIEIDDPNFAVMGGDVALGVPKIKVPTSKTHVFDSLEETLKFVARYLQQDWTGQ